MYRSQYRLWMLVFSTVLFFGGLPAAAQEGPVQLVVGMTPGASYSDIDGLQFQQSYSIGLGYFWAPRWSTEIRGTLDGYSRTSSGDDLEAYSVDVAGHYYFFTGRKWGAFSALGLRYAESDCGLPPAGDDSGTGLLLGLGLERSLSRRFSLRLDLNSVPINFGGYDERLEDTSVAVGFGFRF